MAAPHVTGLAALLKSQDSNRDWVDIKNLILSGGDSTIAMDITTITGKRLNAYGSLACLDSPVFSVLKYPYSVALNKPKTLSAMSINCEFSDGPVVVSTSGGEVVDLHDDGVAPDIIAGDGIFSTSWPLQRKHII